MRWRMISGPARRQVALLHETHSPLRSALARRAAEATGARKLIDRLDQSILVKAFPGDPLGADVGQAVFLVCSVPIWEIAG
jgi:hypothetical protein